jgi:N-acetylglucosaminyldiphosphoundecaprenol N-acetyl-beta-D-mannosaminyltransferase
MQPLPAPQPVLGYHVSPITLASASRWVVAAAHAGEGKLVVTLNPEIVVRARRDAPLADALAHADLTVADGVGILWAARRRGVQLPERVPGVELTSSSLQLGGSDLRVYFLGGRPGVAEAAAEAAQRRWGTVVAGASHGFFDHRREGEGVAMAVHDSGAQLLLAGLGEQQEVFLQRHRATFGVGAMIGVGGTLDVLAGVAQRTPAWTRRWGLEWAWRVGLDPKRWHRLPRLAQFVMLARRTRD